MSAGGGRDDTWSRGLEGHGRLRRHLGAHGIENLGGEVNRDTDAHDERMPRTAELKKVIMETERAHSSRVAGLTVEGP